MSSNCFFLNPGFGLLGSGYCKIFGVPHMSGYCIFDLLSRVSPQTVEIGHHVYFLGGVKELALSDLRLSTEGLSFQPTRDMPQTKRVSEVTRSFREIQGLIWKHNANSVPLFEIKQTLHTFAHASRQIALNRQN